MPYSYMDPLSVQALLRRLPSPVTRPSETGSIAAGEFLKIRGVLGSRCHGIRLPTIWGIEVGPNFQQLPLPYMGRFFCRHARLKHVQIFTRRVHPNVQTRLHIQAERAPYCSGFKRYQYHSSIFRIYLQYHILHLQHTSR